MPNIPLPIWWFLGGLVGLLTVATLAGAWMARSATSDERRAGVANYNDRTRAWWVMAAVVVLAALLGSGVSATLFGMVSFFALREFVTLAPTRRGDHRTLFWLFFAVIPTQYILVHIRWYGLFTVLIPVWVLLFIAARSVGTGDTRDYLARVARIHVGAMLCIYFISHVPMLLSLERDGRSGLGLLLYLITVAQLSDVLQYVWGKLIGRTPVAPSISPKKTWEGLAGGGLSAVLVGTGLWWMAGLTPWQSAGLSAVIVFCGFLGGLVMSAIKRDAGVKDWGHLVPGHGGMLDRVDSLVFAAPAFFHLLRYLG